MMSGRGMGDIEQVGHSASNTQVAQEPPWLSEATLTLMIQILAR